MENIKVAVFLSQGFEEVEAVTILDFLRRADIQALAVSVDNQKEVQGKHGLILKSDLSYTDFQLESDSFQAFVTPGGNIDGLLQHEDLGLLLKKVLLEASNRFVGSICASPLLIKKIGLSEQLVGTAYPAFKDELQLSKYVDQAVVVTEKWISSQGPATALAFTLALVERLRGQEIAERLAQASLFNKFYK